MEKEYTKELAKYIVEEQYENLSDELIELLKKCLLDSIGCLIAGNKKPEIRNFINGIVDGNEKGNATIWGDGLKTPVNTALLVNGSMNHAVELDDLHKPSKIHCATIIVPALLTVGELEKISGKQALLSMLVGYETVIRVAMAIGTDSHRRRGWHGTATCGAFGATATVGKILNLNSIQMANALGLAGTQTGGLMAYTADGSMSKRFHAGRASEAGYISAKLAKSGFTGPTYVLEAKDGGYAHAASDNYNLNIITNGLGKEYHTLNTGHKFYACCGHTHQAIDCAVKIKNKTNLNLNNIEKIVVKTYDVSGDYWGFKEMPKNTVEAQFNFSYVVSAALVFGKVFLPQFSEESLNNKQIAELFPKVELLVDEKYTKRYPEEWCSSVDIYMNDGTIYSEESIGAKGDPVNPLSYEEIVSKFCSLTENIISSEKQQQIIDLVKNIEDIDDIGKLTSLIHNF